MELIDVSKVIKNLNPVNGCTINCPYCYARRINNRFKITDDFSIPQFMEKRLVRLDSKNPKTFLLTSMSDFSDWKKEWTDEVFEKIKDNPQHKYLLLTKRPNKIAVGETLPNTFFGVTVTRQAELFRVNDLKNNVKNNKYFITFEPLFESIDNIDLTGISWVVIGTETGSRKGKITAKKEWILNIVKQCDKNNIPVFMKSSLADIVGMENMRQQLI